MHQVAGCESFSSVAMLSLDGRKALGELQLMSLICAEHATQRYAIKPIQLFVQKLVCTHLMCRHNDLLSLLLLTLYIKLYYCMYNIVCLSMLGTQGVWIMIHFLYVIKCIIDSP